MGREGKSWTEQLPQGCPVGWIVMIPAQIGRTHYWNCPQTSPGWKNQWMQKPLDNVRFDITQKAKCGGGVLQNKALFELRMSIYCILLEEPYFFSWKLSRRKTEKDRGSRWKSGLCPHVDSRKKMFPETKLQMLLNLVSSIPQTGASAVLCGYKVCPGVLGQTYKITRTCLHPLAWRWPSLTFIFLPGSLILLLLRTLAKAPALPYIFILLISLLGCPQKMESWFIFSLRNDRIHCFPPRRFLGAFKEIVRG